MPKQLEALTQIERDRNAKPIERGTIFKAKNQEEEDQLFRLGAVREAPKGAEEGMRTSLSDNPTGGVVTDTDLARAEKDARIAEEQMRREYLELFGSPAHANMKFDTLRARVQEKRASDATAASEQAEKDAAAARAVDTEAGTGGSQAPEASGTNPATTGNTTTTAKAGAKSTSTDDDGV